MKAFITGIAGQDGSYLAEYLLGRGYSVCGTVRRNSTPEHQEGRIAHLATQVRTYYADVTDFASIADVLVKEQPDEVYNLAAQSHVRISSDIQAFTAQVNAMGALNVLEATRLICPTAKFYQASSSEMFGHSVDADGYQRETTSMTPVSPYGCAKLFAYNMVRHYRKAYGLHASNGILFNHESPRRGSNFVTNKIIKAAVAIWAGHSTEVLQLGNLDASRDWGHSADYVRAMNLIVRQPEPLDIVVATGETRTVRELVALVFETLGLDWQEHVGLDTRLLRPQELPYLKGDASRIRALGWKPEYNFEKMIQQMIFHWKNILA